MLSQISESFGIDSGTTTLNLPRSAQAPRRTACWTTFPTTAGRWLHFTFSTSLHTKSTAFCMKRSRKSTNLHQYVLFRDYNFMSVLVLLINSFVHGFKKYLSFSTYYNYIYSRNKNIHSKYNDNEISLSQRLY